MPVSTVSQFWVTDVLSFFLKYEQIFWFLGVLIVTSCFHEAGHAWAAWRLGDRRDYIVRRKRFWSPSHISLPFTLILPVVLFLLAGVGIGGARPVMISMKAIGPWRMVLVALAGPVANLFVGVLSILVFVGCLHYGVISALSPRYGYAIQAIGTNFVLAGLNLLPLPPLDGSRIVAAFLPERARHFYYTALSLPGAALILFGFFFLGKYFPEKVQFIYDFHQKTLPLWCGRIAELIS